MENRNTTSESSIEKYFVQKCKEQGMKVIKMLPTFEAGIPDRQVLYRGVAAFVELKAPGKVPRLKQVVYMRVLREAGFMTGVIDSKKKALEWIKEFKTHAMGCRVQNVCSNGHLFSNGSFAEQLFKKQGYCAFCLSESSNEDEAIS